MKKYIDILGKGVDGSTLGLFRVLFGALMFVYILVDYTPSVIQEEFIDPDVFFPFPLFHSLGLTVVNDFWMRAIFYIQMASAVLITVGLLTRFALSTFFISYGYIFLLEKTYYNNHDYFILLITLILFVSHSHRVWSFDAKIRPKIKSELIPNWNLLLLRFQVIVVYFYGGLAKCNVDWFSGDIMRLVLHHRAGDFALKQLFYSEGFVQVLSFGGFIFDIVIGLLLCIKRTRVFSFVWAIMFHLMNKWMFDIGIFPYLMIATLVLFLEPDYFHNMWIKMKRRSKPNKNTLADSTRREGLYELAGKTKIFISVYIVLQLLIPFRHNFYPGDVMWTNEANRFSWRMFSSMKHFETKVRVVDPATNNLYEIDPTKDISVDRYLKVMITPDMLVQYAQQINNRFEEKGVRNPVIEMDIKVSLNKGPYYYFVDPQYNFGNEKSGWFTHYSWILPSPKSGKGKPATLEKKSIFMF